MKAVVSIMELVALEDIIVAVVVMLAREHVAAMLAENLGVVAVIKVVEAEAAVMDVIMVALKKMK